MSPQQPISHYRITGKLGDAALGTRQGKRWRVSAKTVAAEFRNIAFVAAVFELRPYKSVTRKVAPARAICSQEIAFVDGVIR